MNEYDSIAGELKQSELQGSIYAGARQQPDTEAKLQALAQRTGLPVDVVRIKQPEVELHDRLQSFDYERVIKESPKLSAWLADPKNAAVAHDDWSGLSRTEKLLTHGRDYAGALGQGTVGQGAGGTLSGLGQLNAVAARSIERGLDYVLPDSAMKALKTPIPWWLNPTEILQRPGTQLKQAGEAMAPPKERRTLGTDVASGIGQLGFQIAAFMATGGASSTTMMYAQGADIMADKTAKDNADPALRDTAIVAGGAITALTERYGLDKILNRVPPQIKNRAMRFIADKLAAGGIEAAQEAAEGLLHDVTRRLTTNEDAPMLENIGQEMSAAAIAAGVVRTALGVRGFRQAQQTEQFVAALGEEAKSSKLRERLPDRYRELVERYTADGPVQSLMVPADKFAEYFQSAGMDPAQVAAETGAQNYDEALASGGDVVIPMAGFMAQIAPSDHLQGLMQDVRLAPDEMTAREARDAEANSDAQEKELRAELEGIDAAAKSGQAIDVAIQRVITDVEGQLMARYDPQTARTMATSMRGMAVLANRANPNMDPLEAAQQLWAKYGLTIQANPLPKVLTDAKDFDAVLDPMLDRLRSGKVPTDREIFGPSLFDFLREKGGIREDGGELKYRDLDIWDRENRPKGARRLVNGDGMHFDRARELALEAGYDVGEDINSFLDALDREIDGRTVFSAVNENAELRGQSEGLDGLAKALHDMGLDMDADNATIRRALRGDDGEGYDQAVDPTQAPEFKAWAGTDRPVVEPDEINDFDFSQRGPFVLRAFHGTTNTFEEFNASLKGNMEGQFGAVNYFTSSESDASDNYAGEGPDLTQRIELKAERVSQEIEDYRAEFDDPIEAASALMERYGEDVYDDKDMDMARAIVRKDLHGGDEKVLEVYVKTERPFVVNDDASPWFEFMDEGEIEALAVARVADNEGVTVDEIEASRDDYQDQIDDARYEVMDEQENPLIAAVQTVADKYDFDAGELLSSLYEVTADGSIKHANLEELLRSNESLSYAENPESGDLVQSHMIGEIIQELGFDSIILKNADTRFENMNMEYGTAHIHVFDANNTNIKSVENAGEFDPANPNIYHQDARGSIQISPDRRMKISLFEKADLSTFLHESGHFYLEVMGDLAEAAETDQQVRDDYAAILKFLGVANRSEIKVEHHEKFARANEAYLMEGRAPAPELAGAFQRFRAWMKLIYQQLQTLNVTLTDDVRQVFGRIYATDAEIARAEADAGLQDLFLDAKTAGMTEAEFALYRETVARTSQAGKEKLQTELMRVQKLKREAWWRDELAKTAEEVAAEYDASQASQAAARMWAGERLNRRQLEQRYSKETLDRLPRSKQGRVYAPDGRDIDSLAEVMGFSNADDMVTALVQLPPRARWIAAEADARMLDRYGDLLNDVALSDEATAALHNAERERVIRIELRALNKKIREVAPFVKAERQKARDNRRAALAATETGSDVVTRRIAVGLIGQKEVRDLNPHQYVVAQRKANRAAFKAMASGDHAEAGLQKQRELLNHYLYLEARKAQQEADAIVKFLKPFTADKKRAELAKAGADYLDQIDGILERYEFKPATLKQMQRRESLAGWLDAQEAAGNAVAVPAEVQDDARRVNWRKANIDELRAVRDAVKNIAHLASMKNKLIRKGKAIEFDGVVTELVDALESSGLAPTGELAQPNDKGATLAERAGRTWRKFDAAHIKMEQVVEWLDGGRIDGPWARYFFDLADHAQTMEFDLHREVTTKLEAVSSGMPKAWRQSLLDRTAVRLPGMDAPLTRYTLLSIGMNMGNAQNLQRLQDGYGWSDSDLNLVRDTLTAEDWTFIQSTWDALELLWPHMAALEERMSGLPPEKVEAVPFEVAGLSLRGGYFPLVYDPRFSQAGEKQANEAESVQNFVAQGYGRANTNRGATKARLDQFRAAVKLDYEQVVTSHLAKVIKDISHREAVIGINKILTVPTIKQGLIDRIGEQGYEQARKWLQTLVMDRADTLHQASGLGGLLMKARTNTAIVTMGWKISTMMAQFAGITPVLDLVRPRYLTQALVQAARHPTQTWAFVSQKSGEMRNRSNTIERDMKDALLRLRGEGGALADVRRTAFYLTALADRMVSMPAWLGGYKQALAEGMSEEDAVRAGDRAVRLSQGAGGSKDLAAVQRNNELMKLLTMYYTPFNVLYARLRDLGHQQAVNGIGYLPKAIARFTALVIIPAVLGDLLAGRGPDDDEDEAMWAARKILLYPVTTVPVVRDLSGYLEAGMIEVTGEGEMRFQPSYKLSPVVGAIEKLARVPGKLYDVSTGDKDADEVAWDIFETSGYVLGLPTAQPRITGEYLTDLLSGNADPENAAELMQGALFRRQE